MARIPTFERRQGLDIAAKTIPSTRVDTSSAQALAGLGGTLVSVGERMNQREAQRQEFLAQQGLQRLGSTVEQDLQTLQRDMDPTGQGFHDNAVETFNTRAQEYIQTLPPHLQEKFGERLKTVEADLSTRAAQIELGQWDVYQTDETGKMLDQLAVGISQFGPGSMESYIAQGEEIINSTNLPKIKKQEIIQNWRSNAQITALQAMPPQERKRALVEALGIDIPEATGSVVDQIINVESGGSATAKNPTSSATGAGQFIDSTWIDMIRRHRPDISEGRSRSQILALRTDPQLSREMVSRYAEENASRIQAAGFQPTAGNVYLAHFLGPQGAIDMLRADPNALARDINPGAAKSNKSIFSRRGVPRTAAQIVAWAEQKMGGSRSATEIRRPISNPDPRFADVPLETRVKLINAADAEITGMITERKGELELGIVSGDVTDRNVILDDDLLRDTDKATLLRSLGAKLGETAQIRSDLAALQGGGLQLNAFNADDRKRANNLFNALEVGSVTDPQNANGRAAAFQFVDQTGVIPSSVVAELRQGMRAPDSTTRNAAFEMADALYNTNQTAFARAFDEGDIDLLNDYQALSQTLPPEELDRRLGPEADAADEKALTELRSRGRKLAQDIDTSEILDAFDPGIFARLAPGQQAPDMPIDAVSTERLRGDFTTLFAERFAATGDAEIAKTQALERLKLVWGTTNSGDTPRLVRFPPENYFPPVGGSHEWMQEQLSEAIKERFPDAARFGVVTTRMTEAAIAGKRQPEYNVVIQDENGVYLGNVRWTWDPAPAQDAAREEFRKEHEAQRELDEIRRTGQVPEGGVIEGEIEEFQRIPSPTELREMGQPGVDVPEITVTPADSAEAQQRDAVLQRARDAMANGAARAPIMQQLESVGIDPGEL